MNQFIHQWHAQRDDHPAGDGRVLRLKFRLILRCLCLTNSLCLARVRQRPQDLRRRGQCRELPDQVVWLWQPVCHGPPYPPLDFELYVLRLFFACKKYKSAQAGSSPTTLFASLESQPPPLAEQLQPGGTVATQRASLVVASQYTFP